MTALNKTVSTIALALAGAFATSAIAGNHSYSECSNPAGDPKNGCQVPVTGGSTTNNNNHNSNANNNSNKNNNNNANHNSNANNNSNKNNNSNANNNNNTAKATAKAEAIAKQQQAQQQAQSLQNAVKVDAAGGKAINGSSASNNVQNTTFEAAEQVGNAPAVYLNPTGECGEAVSVSVGFIGGAIGGGATSQSRICLSQKAGIALLNAGLVLKDDGMIVASMETLAAIHPEIKAGLEAAGVAFSTTCAKDVVKVSRVLGVGLTQAKCDTLYANFTPVAAVPVVPAEVVVPAAAVVVTEAKPELPDLNCGAKPIVYDPRAKAYKCGNDLN